MLRTAVIILLIALLPSCGRKRIALLIGNEAYAGEIAMMAPHADVRHAQFSARHPQTTCASSDLQKWCY
jgi:hypothetical protein